MIIRFADTNKELMNVNIDSMTAGFIAIGAAKKSGRVMELVDNNKSLAEVLKEAEPKAPARIQMSFSTPETQAVVDSFTPLEKSFMDAFIKSLYAEIHFSDVDVKDIARTLGAISLNQVKGVLGSLVKKGVVWTEDSGTGYDIIYLNSEYFFLHPEWKYEQTGW